MKEGRSLTERMDRLMSVGIGWVSLLLGVALTLAPREANTLLGWDGRERLARVIGAADLIVGTGLLVSRRPSRWMLGRTLLNVVIGGFYASV